MEELIESIMEEILKVPIGEDENEIPVFLEEDEYFIKQTKQILTEKLEKVEREFKNLEEHARKMDEYIHTNHKSETVVHKKVFDKVEKENASLKSRLAEAVRCMEVDLMWIPDVSVQNNRRQLIRKIKETLKPIQGE